MKLMVLYRPNSEHSTELENYLKEFTKLHPNFEIALVNYDSLEGTAQANLYGIMEQPALLVVDSYGSMIASWAGGSLPLMDEIAGYMNH